MKRFAFLNVVKWVACIVFIVFVFFQFYQLFYNPFTTGTAVYFETLEGIETVAVAVRDEKILNQDDVSGAKRYLVMDGEKVSKNGIIAEIYASAQDASAKSKVEELDEQINRLTEIQNYNDLSAANLSTIDIKIRRELIGILAGDTNGKFGSSKSVQELLYLLNRRQIITGQVGNFSGVLSSLAEQKRLLETGANLQPVSTIKTEYSGYFVSSSDGYESILTPDTLDSITGQTIREVLNNKGNGGGDKVISEYSWFLAAELSLSDSLKLKKGSNMVLRTNTDSNPELPVTVHAINRSADGTSVVVIFKCNYINGELATMRTIPITIVLGSYDGLKIPSESVRWVNGESGVYKVLGNRAVFVPIDIIYSTESYVVCRKISGGDLKLYDEVIVKGKQLYDGKIIR